MFNECKNKRTRFTQDLRAAWIVEPIFKLIVEKKWKTIMVLRTWGEELHPDFGWPHACQVLEEEDDVGDDEDGCGHVVPKHRTGELLARTVDTLCLATPHMLDAANNQEERDAKRKDVKSLVRQLQHHDPRR